MPPPAQTTTRTGPAPRLRIRAIDSETELHQFVRWAAMSGIADPDYFVEQLLDAHEAGFLGGHPDTPPPSLIETLHRHGPALAAATRTTVAVAVADGRLVGGVVAGPTLWHTTTATRRTPDLLVRTLRRTSELQVLAVGDTHRRCGIGTELLHTALTAAAAGRCEIVYGQCLDTPAHTSLYHRAGFTVHPLDTPVNLTNLADIDLTLISAAAHRLVTATR